VKPFISLLPRSHEVRYSMLSYRELLSRSVGGAIALVPLGCTEQQGPHLAVGFDTWFAEELCVAAADVAHDEFGIDAIVLPVLPFGPTPEHRRFGVRFVDLPEAVHDAVVEVILGSLAEQGFKRILVWRGCGGHRLQTIVANFNEAMNGRSIAHLPGHPFHAIWCRLADPSVSGGHADSFATSIALYRHPEQVRLDQIPEASATPDWDDPQLDFSTYSVSGVIGDPTHASAELGESLWEACVDELAKMLRELAEHAVPPRNEPTRLDY
jgi:creatinine amidohydrolase